MNDEAKGKLMQHKLEIPWQAHIAQSYHADAAICLIEVYELAYNNLMRTKQDVSIRVSMGTEADLNSAQDQVTTLSEEVAKLWNIRAEMQIPLRGFLTNLILFTVVENSPPENRRETAGTEPHQSQQRHRDQTVQNE